MAGTTGATGTTGTTGATGTTGSAAPKDAAGELSELDQKLRDFTGFGLAHALAQLLSERHGIPAGSL